MQADTRVRLRELTAQQVEGAVDVFRMLADPTRVRLLWAVLDKEVSVQELADAVGKPAAGVSQHLAKLRMARVVRTRQQTNQVFYRIANAHLRQLVEDAIYHAEHATGGVPAHHRADDPPRAPGTRTEAVLQRTPGTERVTR